MPAETLSAPIPLGIDADTGLPLPEIDPGALDFFISNDRDLAPSNQMLKKVNPEAKHFGTTAEVDAAKLHEAGWAVMLAPSVTQEIRDALQPLIDHRKLQVDDDRIFKIFEGGDCCLPNETAVNWLAREPRGVSLDVVDPLNGVPYYVMLVGPPEEISFEFQYGLDLYWAVGRVWFPTAAEFRNYAESVIRYETMPAPPTSRQVVIFAPRHDRATQLVHDQLAQPLLGRAEAARPIGQSTQYRLREFLDGVATKNTLGNIYSGAIDDGPPALLFTGSHGMRYNPGDERQERAQGALLCQDWGGTGGTNPAQYFQASDLAELSNAKVHGLVQFMFACYGGGCPELDAFDRKSQTPARVAPKPLLARLPQTLMGREGGGALAVLAHVERTWTSGFRLDQRPQVQGFRDVMTRLLQGNRIGHATDQFNIRWAALSASLADLLQNARDGFTVDPGELADLWKRRDDARNFVVLGDPAVRVRVDEMPVL